MQVNGLNHINIVTADMAGTVEFYESEEFVLAYIT